jgi:hypothetical protein
LVRLAHGERTPFAEECDAAWICPYALLQAELEAADLGVTTRCLQPVGREICEKLKEGEAEKQKSYSAVIWAARALTPADLDTLRSVKDLVSDCHPNPSGLRGLDAFGLRVCVPTYSACSLCHVRFASAELEPRTRPLKAQSFARQQACNTDVILLSWPMALLV